MRITDSHENKNTEMLSEFGVNQIERCTPC